MSKLVPINIRPGIRLPHNIEGVDVVAADMLVDLETKQRLMALRPGLFHKNDPDRPKKVARVELVEQPVLTGEVAPELVVGPPVIPVVTTKSKSKKSDGDNPS